MKQLVLVRHGESEWNVERRIQGQSGTGLSVRGRDQAVRTAAWLADSYPRAAVFSSDLQRCRETVAPLIERTGADLTLERGLRERHFGAWTERLVEDVRREEPDLWQRWRDGDDVIAEIGGEGTDEFTERVVGTYEQILASLDDGDAAICVTHGGPVWHGTRTFVGLGLDVLGGVANASVTEIVSDETWGHRLASWNQVAHLPVDLRTTFQQNRSTDGDDQRDEAEKQAPPVGR